MSWRLLTDAERHDYLNRVCFIDDDEEPKGLGRLQVQSPCGLLCEARGGLDYAVALLYSMSFHIAVGEIVDRCCREPWAHLMDHRHLSEHLIVGGQYDKLSTLLERSVDTCDYVLALPTNVAFDEHLTHACDLARSARARHEAAPVLRGL